MATPKRGQHRPCLLSFTGITNITPYATIQSLQWLDVSHNLVTDISALAFHPNLMHIFVENNTISDVRVMDTLPQISNLKAAAGTLNRSEPGVYQFTWSHVGRYNRPQWGQSFSGEAIIEVVAASTTPTNPNPGGGSNTPTPTPKPTPTGFTFVQIIPTPDVTGDSYGDVLAVDTKGVLWLYPGTATGALGPAKRLGGGWTDLTISAPGDFNQDGWSDILAKAPNGDLFFYAGKAGGFRAAVKVGSGW